MPQHQIVASNSDGHTTLAVSICLAPKLSEDSDLWQSIKRTEDGIEFRLPDKLRAVEVDNNLAGTDSEAAVNDSFTQLLARCMK